MRLGVRSVENNFQSVRLIATEVVLYNSIHSSSESPFVPAQATSLITTERTRETTVPVGGVPCVAVGRAPVGVGVRVGVRVRVGARVGVGVRVRVGVIVGVGVRVGTREGVALIKNELALLGVPQIGSPFASWPVTVMLLLVTQALGSLSETKPTRSILQDGEFVPAGQPPPSLLTLSIKLPF